MVNTDSGFSSFKSKFTGEALPRMPLYELTSPMPEIVAPGKWTLDGTVEAGAKMHAELDGKELSVKVDKKGKFSVELPLTEAGEKLLQLEHKR